MKVCYVCKNEKELTEYSSDKSKRDGLNYRCKDCNKEYYSQPRIRKMQRKCERKARDNGFRVQTKEYNAEYYQNNKERISKYKKEWREDNIKECNAREMFYQAFLEGSIKRPCKCNRCDIECTPEGHHEDYDKPLCVEWLCKKCHINEHRFIED